MEQVKLLFYAVTMLFDIVGERSPPMEDPFLGGRRDASLLLEQGCVSKEDPHPAMPG